MRISDWSSDVCSSDLAAGPAAGGADEGAANFLHHRGQFGAPIADPATDRTLVGGAFSLRPADRPISAGEDQRCRARPCIRFGHQAGPAAGPMTRRTADTHYEEGTSQ